MNEAIFLDLLKTIGARRPTWTYIIEDSLIRLYTQQFTVDWAIIDEITGNKNLQVVEVTSHSQAGQVISIRYIGGV